jgi:hypothetical protein
MTDFFKPEDFERWTVNNDDETRSKTIADIANTKLKRKGLVVFGPGGGYWNEERIKNDTHKAIVINIEPIQKEPCNHLNTNGPNKWIQIEGVCKKCGEKL